MNQFMQALVAFGQSSSIWVYVFICAGKIFEVTLAVMRIVLINRGERVAGCLVSLAEVFVWLLVTGTVLTGFQSDFIKVIVFCAAFGVGNWLGSFLEERLAFGLCSIQAIIPDRETANAIAKALCDGGFGVTQFEVKGREGQAHYMVFSTLKRRLAGEAIRILQSLYPNAPITVSDVKSQKGGYLRNATVRRAGRLMK